MREKLGEILVRKSLLNEEVVEDALSQQHEGDDRRLGNILIERTELEMSKVFEALLEQTGLDAVSETELKKQDIPLLAQFPIFLARKYKAMPLFIEGGKLFIVVSTTDFHLLFNQLYMIYSATVKPLLVDDHKITDLINSSYSKLDTGAEGLDAEEFKDMSEEDDTTLPDLIDSNDEAPIIRFVNNMISKAAKEKVSDIHFESFEDEVLVRFRKDGRLKLVQKVPKAAQAGLITRVKIMGKLNISEKRLPQDGNIKVKIAGNDIDLRLSTLPSTHGESVVLRLLDKTSQKLSLDESGFTQRDLKSMRELIRKKHGIFLVCGPTGSGKTTTLYSALTEINSPDVKIITEEDPVEYQLKGRDRKL